jgi:hypothetical protein
MEKSLFFLGKIICQISEQNNYLFILEKISSLLDTVFNNFEAVCFWGLFF